MRTLCDVCPHLKSFCITDCCILNLVKLNPNSTILASLNNSQATQKGG